MKFEVSLALLFSIICFSGGAFALSEADSEEVKYESLYPFSAEVCAVSQKKPTAGNHEKYWGHVTLVLNGVCRDRSKIYPQLKLCDSNKTVIVSVNSFLKNVMWLAAEGRDFAFRGDLKPGERLGREQYDRTLARAVTEGVFDGIKIHEETWDKKSEWSSYLGHNAVDTDFAINFGRDVFCSRLPMPPPVAKKVVEHLNEVNTKIANDTETFYQWHPLYWNCAHLVNNTLAAVGISSPLSENVSFPRQIFNLAVPGNVVLNFADLGQETRWIDPMWAFKRPEFRQTLESYSWFPAGPGFDFKFYPRYEANDLYLKDLDLFVLDHPFGSRKDRLLSYAKKSGQLNFEDDLKKFQALYTKALEAAKILASRKTAELEKLSSKERPKFEKFLVVYQGYMERQLADIESKLILISQTAASTETGVRQSTIGN